MRGKTLALSLLTLLSSACGYKSEHYEKRAQVERITSLLDSQSYGSVIEWYENAVESTQKEFRRYYVFAKLRRGGFDSVSIINDVLEPQRYRSRELYRLAGDCKNERLDSFDQPKLKCLMVRLANQLPDPNHPDIIDGERMLVEMANRNELSDADQTLLLILETAIIVRRVTNVLEAYLAIDPDTVADEDLVFFYNEMQKAALDSQRWIERMEKSPEKVSQRITGLTKVSLLKKVNGNTTFLKETGIPFVLKNVKKENRESIAVLARIFLIQTVGTVVREYFGVDPSENYNR
ncbi:MAG TPA: hypothetical protein VM901_03655 [Bdellovibrionota bacterium]|jgi:hypothetical protein|nr:hypothetical protein [Bdellovibrionota bacterium]